MPLVRLRSVVCLLGRFPALAGLDLDVERGEVVLLSGPNGAGKTTVLRAVAGLVPIVRGEATVLGVDLVADRRRARRGLALVGHETFCYDDLTVGENLRFLARAAGRDVAAVPGLVERVGLTEAESVTHRRLSAGQRRRLALAAAWVREPELLLLDEPHAGLDADGREVLHRVVADCTAAGRTVVMSSHELDLARELATREVRIENGQARVPVASGSAP